MPIAIAREHKIEASGQWLADRLESLATHENGFAERNCLETTQVFRQTPRQSVVATDDAVLRHRDDHRNEGIGHSAQYLKPHVPRARIYVSLTK